MNFGSDPGIYVQQVMEQRPLEPVFGDMPTAIIGPVVNVQKDVEFLIADITTDETIIFSELEGIEDPINSIKGVEVKIVDGRGAREPVSVWEEGAEDNPIIFEWGYDSVVAKLEDDVDYTPQSYLNDTIKPMFGDTLEGAKFLISYNENRNDLAAGEETYLSAQGVVGIQQAVGLHFPENPLGIAGWLADSVAPNTAVIFVPTRDYINDEAEDADIEIPLALSKIMNVKVANVVALAPDDKVEMEKIDNLMINHAQVMSSEEENQFRFAWCGMVKPESLEDGAIARREDEVEKMTSYTQSTFERKASFIFQGGTFDLLGEGDVHLNPSYIAAMTAVFKSSIEPEQGMTRLPLGGPLKKLDYHDRYQPSLLKKLSENGVWVYTQRNAGENISCRFQTTSNTLNNRTRQQSVQATLDFVSYSFIETLDSLTGVNNVTDEIVETVDLSAKLLISTLKRNGKLRSGSNIMETFEDPNNSSRIRIRVKLVIPTPLDQIVVTLVF